MPQPHFEHVFQLLPTPSVMLLADAPKFTIVAANNAYLEAVSLSEKDLIGKGIFEAFPKNPQDPESTGAENLRNSLEIVISKKESHKMPLQTYHLPVRGTSEFQVNIGNIQNIPIKNKDNSITHILHSIEDVTDKKNLEIAFETERQRFTDLYLQAPSCMGILKGPNHVYEMANPTYLQLINRKNIIGKSIKEIRPETVEQGLIEILDQVYKTGKAFSANERPSKLDKEANGEIVDIYQDLLLQPHKDYNGKIDGICFFFIDVTEKVESRKKIEESEKRYLEFIENLPIATYSCNAEGHVLIYNKAAAVLWDGKPEIEKDLWCGSGKIYNEHGNPIPCDKSPMAIALKEGRKITDQEIIIERPNGDRINIMPNSVPFLDSSGRVTGAVNVLIDISARKKAELKLKQSEKSLKESQEVGHMGNWELNFATGITIWSDETCRIYGLPLSENNQSYASWLSFIHPEDLDEVLTIISESQKTYSDTILNYRIILRDGTIKHIYEKSKFSFDKTGEPVGNYGISLDVTDTAKAIEKTRFQSNLLNIITQAAISADTNGIINFWNKAATEIYGWTAEEALGKNPYSLISTERKEGDTMEILEELSKGNSSNENEYVVKHKDGHTFSVFASLSPIYDKQGKFKGAIEVSLDITGRKKEEEKLAKLNKELSDYKYALDESSIVAITDQKGTIKHVNDNFCKITQFSTEELIGQNHRIINSGFHSKEFFRNMWKTISSGKIWKGEVKNKAKDGSIYWVDTIITPLLDEQEKPYRYVVTRFDITERKKAELTLKLSEKKYRQIVETTQEGIWVIDKDTQTTFVNNRMGEILEYSQEEMIGKHLYFFMDEEAIKTADKLSQRDKYACQIPFKFISKSGKTVWTNLSLNPLFDEDNNYKGGLAMVTDITKGKNTELILTRNEEKLKYAEQEANIGNWEMNFETGIYLWSEEACKIHGFSPKDNKQTFSFWLSFIHPEDVAAVLKLIDESKKTLSDIILNYRIILKDGTIKFIYGKSKFEFDNNQKPIGLYGTSQDVTESKKVEQQLENQNKYLLDQNREKEKRATELILANLELDFQNGEKEKRATELSLSNKELVKTNTELDRFVYSVSHDLRSPLTSILGLISFIEEDSREPDTLEQVKMIRDSINRLDGFIKNILSYSQNNRTSLEAVKIPIEKTINEIVNSVRNIKGAKGISFQVDIDEQQPFYSDWQRLNTILENLISNAIKYHTEEVSGRYLNVTGRTDKEGLTLSISDNGIGIDAAYHEKIFDMFYRLSGKTPGSGFGLYIVKETLEKMNGKIEVQSEKGVGTTFIITLKNLKE